MSTPETGLNIKELIQRKKVSFKDVDERIPLLKEALDKMREDSAGFETRMAVVDSGMRCEYFRGKDFLRYWMSRPGELAYYLGKAEDDQTAEAKEPEEIKDQVIILAIFCMAGNLIRTAERKHTKPRPGKKKLPKWPTTLVSRYLDWDEELFYRFTYERPRGVMFYACAALLLALATFCCFYSLVPNQIKVCAEILLVHTIQRAGWSFEKGGSVLRAHSRASLILPSPPVCAARLLISSTHCPLCPRT